MQHNSGRGTVAIPFGSSRSHPRRDRRVRLSVIYTGISVLICILCYLFVTAMHAGSGVRPALASRPPGQLGAFSYAVVPGDTLQTIASAFGIPQASLQSLNHTPPDATPRAGQKLLIPSAPNAHQMVAGFPSGTRHLIETTARRFHVETALALAIAWQESRADQGARSSREAVGIMQVEPATGEQVAVQLGSTIDLENAYDNVTAGVYWLGFLMRYYHGDMQQAAAAYYEGQSNFAQYGYLPDARQYMQSVLRYRMAFAAP